MVKDPVCGMDISKDSVHHVESAGQTYYFCSDSCLGKFEATPRKLYVSRQIIMPLFERTCSLVL